MNKYGVPMSHKDKENREDWDAREDQYMEYAEECDLDDSVKIEKIIRSKPSQFDGKDKSRKERRWKRIEKRT